MLNIRRSDDRGHGQHGWLESRHTFSFAGYWDANHMGFRSLRVINEDRVIPGRGFGTHGHRDMEIISYVLEGALEHEDSMGTGSVIQPGDVQRMSAGSGVLHSEYNASKIDPVHFLQIWIVPNRSGIEPSYEQKRFPKEEKTNRWRLAASPDGAEGSVLLHQDAKLYVSLLDAGEPLRFERDAGRHLWMHVARGTVEVDGIELSAGDGVSTSDATELTVTASEDAELLLFDLA